MKRLLRSPPVLMLFLCPVLWTWSQASPFIRCSHISQFWGHKLHGHSKLVTQLKTENKILWRFVRQDSSIFLHLSWLFHVWFNASHQRIPLQLSLIQLKVWNPHTSYTGFYKCFKIIILKAEGFGSR